MATIVVEDGTVVAWANSYVTEAELTTYAADRGITLTAATDVLLIKAMDYIESLSFIGSKFSEGQSLQWPRSNVYIDGFYFVPTIIPPALQTGQIATALAIDSENSPLLQWSVLLSGRRWTLLKSSIWTTQPRRPSLKPLQRLCESCWLAAAQVQPHLR